MKKLIKKVAKFYFNGMKEMYGPAIKAGINPYIF